jgi:hypothetical protein
LLNFSEAIFVAGKTPQQAHSGATQLLGQRSRREKEAAQNDKLLFTHSIHSITKQIMHRYLLTLFLGLLPACFLLRIS